MRTEATFQIFDAPGHFIKYMAKNFPVYAVHVNDVLEVGDLTQYKEADSGVKKWLASKKQQQNCTYGLDSVRTPST